MRLNPLIYRKFMMGGTGLFLCVFLIVHLSANCILLLPEAMARPLYNSYSTTLRESPLIKIVAYLLYASILLHVIYALQITWHNRKAKPQRYQVLKPAQNSTWTSRNMGVIGGLILIFLVIHLVNFWARIKLGLGEVVGVDAHGHKDVYEVTYSLFQNSYMALFYAVMAWPLALHLYHGLQSGFKSFGFYHQKGLKVLAKVALIYAVIMGVGFGIIPVIVYLK